MNISPNSNNQYYIVHIGLPLILGGTIYLLFRSKNLMMFSIIENIGLTQIVNQWRLSTICIKPFIPNWAIYSLPNSLWLYSMMSFWLSIWNHNLKIANALILSSLIFCIFLELLQKTHWIVGTFCMTDIFLSILFFSVFITLHSQKLKSTQYV